MSYKHSRFLKEEIEHWVRDGIVTPEQAAVLHERYQLDREAPWYLRSGFLLKALALLLGAMGLLLIISQNWSEFSVPVQMSIALVPLLISYVIGFTKLLKGETDEAELAFFFSTLALGANIFLQAQIFHISSYFPNGILWWILGTLPFAWYFKSSVHIIAVQVLTVIWLSMQTQFEQFSWFATVICATVIWLQFRTKSFPALVLSAGVAFTFLLNIESVLSSGASDTFLFFIAAFMLLVRILTGFLTEYPPEVLRRLRGIATGAIIFIMYLATFKGIADDILNDGGISFVAWGCFAASVVMLFFKRDIANFIAAALVALIALFSVMDIAEGLAALLANLALLGYALWSMGHGIRHRFKSSFMSGIFIILTLAVSRYFDFFDSYIMMAIIFILSGVALYAVNNFWNKRYGA